MGTSHLLVHLILVARAMVVAATEPAAVGLVSPVALMTFALTIAVAALLAAFFLGRSSAESKPTSKPKEKPASGEAEDSTSASIAGSTSAGAAGTVDSLESKPVQAAQGGAHAPARASVAKQAAKPVAVAAKAAAKTPTPAPAKVPAKVEEGPPLRFCGPPLIGGRELWLLRTVAVKRLVDAHTDSSTPDVAEMIKRRVWAYLDDRPKMIATGCTDGQGRVFALRTGKMLFSAHHNFSSKSPVSSILLDSRGPQLMTTTWDGKWQKWDEWPQKPHKRYIEFGRGESGLGHENTMTGMAMTRDGLRLACAASAGKALVYRAECPTTEIVVTETEDIQTLNSNLKMGDYNELYLLSNVTVAGVKLQKDHCMLEEASFEGCSCKRELRQLELPATLRFRFVGCLTRGHCRHWKVLPHDGAVNCLAISAEGSKEFLYTGSRDRTLKKWNLANGSLVHTYRGHTSMVRCVAVNGRCMASGGDDRVIRIWHRDVPELERILTGHSDFVRCVSLCATFQERLVSSGDDCRVIMWDVRSGERLREYTYDTLVLALRLQESQLLTAAEDKYLRVWNAVTGACQQKLRHPGAVTCLSVP